MPKAKRRCAWAVDDPLLIQYHDEEWGVPLNGDDELFERLTLEIFQAGLSWRTILHKREALRRAFSRFSIKRVAAYGKSDVARLLNDSGIIRNRLKIESTIENARRLRELVAEHGSFASYIKGLNGTNEELYKQLKKKFCFMGPKIAECFLQSIGRIDGAHEPGCSMASRKPRRTRAKR
jgi:DNA-3-methyladenine glycosylase I